MESVNDVAQIAGEVLDAVGARRESLAIALPDLALVTALYPSSRKGSERDLRREFLDGLPFPAGEARWDFWRGRRGEVLGAAVRNPVAHQYEQIVEAVDCRLGWVDGASLSRIPAWSARPHSNGELTVDLQLYLGHYFMSVFRSGELVDARTKLRTAADVSHVCEEVLRVPALHGCDSVDSLAVFGAGASEVSATLEPASDVHTVLAADDSEELQLEASIKTLVERGRP